jgi:surface antigen
VTSFPRRLGAVVVAGLLAGAGVATIAPPASATVTTLCVGYTGCARAGYSSSGYSTAGSSMYWRMFSGHNCTNYAAYRMVRSGLPNSRPWTGSGNATNWGAAMSRITNGTPSVGAVAWWRAGVYPAGSAGHVAYVEKVVSPTEIIVSMDSWHGDFSWAQVSSNSRGWPSGFIHFNDVHLTNTGAPTVSGTPKVGTSLTASHGTWSTSTAAFAYQWLADGSAIKNATSSTFTPTNALTGKRLSIRVTASATGFPTTSAVSAATAAVQPGVLTSTAAPTISGDSRVGSTLSALAGSWDPAPSGLSYQWLAGGTSVAGATDSTLALDPSFVGKAVTVKVTATRTGYAAVSKVSAATAHVEPGTMTMASRPTVSGTTAPARTLQLGAVSVDRNATAHVQWQRGGARIPGATGTTYRLGSADLGHRVRARIRITREGYTPLVVRTPWSRLVRTTPIIHLSAVPGTNRMILHVTMRARGLSRIADRVQVRTGGRLVRVVPIRGGVASASLAGLREGTRTYRFRIPATDATEPVVVTRRLTIG